MLGEHISIAPRYGKYVFISRLSEATVDLPKVGEAILAASFHWVEDVVSTKTEICIQCSYRTTKEDIQQITELSVPGYQPETYRLPVLFDGADWPAVTEATNLPQADIISTITSTAFTYAMHGFLPGFMYLDGLPAELQCPRKVQPAARPISKVFALGGPYAGVYDLPSPSGWYAIGKLPIRIYVKESSPLLRAGDKVRVESITADQFEQLDKCDLTLQSYQLW